MCTYIKFHGSYKEESYYLSDIIEKPYGQLYLKYQLKNRKSFNPLLKEMNKQILNSLIFFFYIYFFFKFSESKTIFSYVNREV